MRYLEGHKGQVLSLAYSPDGRTLASGDAYQTVRLWDVETGESRALLRPRRPRARTELGVTGLAFHPDGRTLATAGGRDLSLWDAASGKEQLRLDGHAGPPRVVTFTPGGTLISGARDGGMVDGEVIVWGDGEGGRRPGRRLSGLPVWSLSPAPDGATVAL